MLFQGIFAATLLTGGIAARQTDIANGPLAPVLPTGTPGALVNGIHNAIAPKLITVVDFGRGHVTAFLQSANNRTRILTAVGGLSATHYRLAVDGANARSAELELTKVVSGNASAITGTVEDYDPGVDGDNNPLPDSRTALDLALAEAWTPARPSYTFQSALDRIMRILHANNVEGFAVCDEQEQEIRVFVVSDTSGNVSFQSASGVASIDANSFIGVYSVPEVVQQAASSSSFIG